LHALKAAQGDDLPSLRLRVVDPKITRQSRFSGESKKSAFDDLLSMMFKARIDGVILHSNGCKMLGGFYGAAGETPRPTVLLLHGIPGVEKNLDFAYALRDAGWNCLYFHYRGCWGSEGNYSLNGLLEDVRQATEWVVKQASVDVERLALIGSSLGGYLTLAAGAADSRFKTLIAICPLVDPRSAPLRAEAAEEFASMLHGVSGEELRKQWNNLQPVSTMAEELQGRRILLVTADEDEFFQPDHYQPFMRKIPHIEWRRFAEADHSFSGYRKQLVEEALAWLSDREI
jgi:pimeloyl-ACP methyl ester carboxylesterase